MMRALWLMIVFVPVMALSLASPALAQGWSYRIGRASDDDVARVKPEMNTLDKALSNLRTETAKQLEAEKRSQLRGEADPENFSEILAAAGVAWDQKVLPAAVRIAQNRGATCGQAMRFLTTMVTAAKQGLVEAAEFQSLLGSDVVKATSARCQEEALDECLVTGRYLPPIEFMLGEERQLQLLGIDYNATVTWLQGALEQCARYELKFVSTGHSEYKPPDRLGSEAKIEGLIPLRYHVTPGHETVVQMLVDPEDVITGKTGDETDNEAAKAANPWVLSLTCNGKFVTQGQKTTWTCPSEAKAESPFEATIKSLDVKHDRFGMANGERTVESVGEDKLMLSLIPQSIIGLLKIHADTYAGSGDKTFDMDVWAHTYLDLKSPGFDVVTVERGVYPELFKFTRHVENGKKGAGGYYSWNTTKFTLVHTPDLKKPKVTTTN